MTSHRDSPARPSTLRRRAAFASRRIEQPDRRALERAGWRTLLDYSENHVRARDGRLLQVEPRWTAEAERALGGDAVVASVTSIDLDDVWVRLRQAVADAERDRRRVRARSVG